MLQLQAVPVGALFELRGPRLPRGWVELRLELAAPAPSAPRLLIDDGAGFTDATALVLPLPREGRVDAVVELPRNLRALALTVPATVTARELGFLESAVRLAKPILQRRLAEPWTIPQAALKFARALVT